MVINDEDDARRCFDIPKLSAKICEHLKSAKPKHPDVGWHVLEDVLYAVINDYRSIKAGVRHLKSALRSHTDPCYKIDWDLIRLLRKEPWPIELASPAGLEYLLAVYRRQVAGFPLSTPQDIAYLMGKTASSSDGYLLKLTRLSALTKQRPDHYGLAITPDFPLWVWETTRPGSGRLTTLAQEINPAFTELQVPEECERQKEALELVLASVQQSISRYTATISSLTQQERHLRKLLAGE